MAAFEANAEDRELNTDDEPEQDSDKSDFEYDSRPCA